MYVQTLASARIEDRVYELEACQQGGVEPRNDWRITILEDKEGAGTHDRFIAGTLVFPSYAEASYAYAVLQNVALHHEGTNPFS